MPFTPCHPAAVLGLARWGLPASALVIGSIAPDLPMLLPVPVVVHFAHTGWGLLTLDPALGVVVFFMWQAFFRPAVEGLAPRGVRVRLPPGAAFHFRRLPMVVPAVFLGALTHVLWDSFTHEWMWGPAHVPWLASRHGTLWGWQWVQRVSDVAGGAIIVAWLIAWWRRTPPRDREVVAVPVRYQLLAWLAVLCPAAVGFGHGLATQSGFHAITRGAGFAAAGLCAVTATWWLYRCELEFLRSHRRLGP